MDEMAANVVGIAIGQQDPQPPRDRRLQVQLRRPGQEAQGHQPGSFLTPSFASFLSANATKVNPDIVGGLVVEIGDRTIDLSVSSKVSRMNKLLQDTL